MTALSQVEHHVDALVDQVSSLLPVVEVSGESFKGRSFEGLNEHGER